MMFKNLLQAVDQDHPKEKPLQSPIKKQKAITDKLRMSIIIQIHISSELKLKELSLPRDLIPKAIFQIKVIKQDQTDKFLLWRTLITVFKLKKKRTESK